LRIVLDTNVLVSGLLSPHGPPATILRLVLAGNVRLCVDARILVEYTEVLARPKFGFADDAMEALLTYLEATSESVVSEPIASRLPDSDDEPFLEVLLTSRAECLVTGNVAHFPPSIRGGALVLAPSEFVQHYRKNA
jgi:uncharacterized protein